MVKKEMGVWTGEKWEEVKDESEWVSEWKITKKKEDRWWWLRGDYLYWVPVRYILCHVLTGSDFRVLVRRFFLPWWGRGHTLRLSPLHYQQGARDPFRWFDISRSMKTQAPESTTAAGFCWHMAKNSLLWVQVDIVQQWHSFAPVSSTSSPFTCSYTDKTPQDDKHIHREEWRFPDSRHSGREKDRMRGWWWGEGRSVKRRKGGTGGGGKLGYSKTR